jgi:Tfp pilus assembly protein PilF
MPRIHVLEDPLSAEEHNQLGYIYESQGHCELAEKEYARAHRMRRGWAVPLFNLGNIHYRRGSLGEAEKCYRKALRNDPQHCDSMNNLAWVLSEQGRHEEARKWIARAISIRQEAQYLDTRMKIMRAGKGSDGGQLEKQ